MSILRVKDDSGNWIEIPAIIGPKGEKGAKGDKGDKPIRGTDYWTEGDKDEIKAYVEEAILGGAW